MTSGEYVSIASEEGYELLTDYGVSECSNFGRFARIGTVKWYFFKLFYWLRHRPVLFYAQSQNLIFHFHHDYVAFPRGHLASAQLPYSVVNGELDH